jgi:hypothetical protein
MKTKLKTTTKTAAANFAALTRAPKKPTDGHPSGLFRHWPPTRATPILAIALFSALLPVAAHADRGGGSIRAAARPAPPPPREVRPQAPHPPPDARPQPRPEDHPEARPVDRPEDHPQPPRVDASARRDWDDNDDDTRSWGGFARGAPVRVIRGQRFHDVPASHRVFVFNNVNYFYDDDGAYYLQQPQGDYLVVQPPFGAVIPALPDGTTPIQVGPTTYYYLDGEFYVAQDDSFLVVNPPPGIVVPALPSDASQVIINGNVCYQFNGFNYTPSIQDGVTVYAVNPV